MSEDFPNNENGDVLRRMEENGVNLTNPRVVNFEHCFSSEASARSFLEQVRDSVDEVIFYEPELEEEPGNWEVQCRVRIIPTYLAITETEERLASVARSQNGYPDGWGSLSNSDGSPAE